MISVICPYCEHSSTLKKVEPGRFQPRCKGCNKKFLLVIKSAGDKVAARAWTMEEVNRKKRQTEGVAGEQDATRQEPESPETPAIDSNATSADTSGETRQNEAGDTRVDSTPSPVEQDFVEARPAQPAAAGPMPQRLGGYKIVRELGRGGLGVVYLAHQLSLDRHVALKTIQDKISKNSAAISRFIREAYAAAQLVHHNVVQIYDLGRDGQTNFFSMEFVPGENLAQMVWREGPLEPHRAASLILQAARGLQFAHQRGMVHRDIKPANLMLNDQGIVKVADLGLVKLAGDEDEARDKGFDQLAEMSGEDLTLANFALGTANYMAPEQADNSAAVDHRADIYSLGCTLYVLLTGQPPFRGKSAVDVITKHRTQPVVRPELIVDRIDGKLSDIVVRMVAKKPDQRYEDLNQVIDELQGFLGISSQAEWKPDEQQVATLQQTQQAWCGMPLAKLRTWAPLAFAGLCLVAALILSFINWRWASGVICLALVAPLAWSLISGIRDRGPLYEKVRELFIRGSKRRWLTALVAAMLLLVVLGVSGLLTVWIVFAIFGIAMAATWYFGVDAQLQRQRADVLQPLQKMLNQQRLAGVDEKLLRQFVARFGGKDWEELFEEVFGYQAMREARADLVTSGEAGKRKKFRPWRDPVIDNIDQRLAEAKQQSDAKKLGRVEREALVAAGVVPEAADAQARQFADAMVREAAQWRSAPVPVADNPALAAQRKRQRIKAMLAEARGGKVRQQTLSEKLDEPMDMLFGGHVRLILGSLLIAGCAMWVWQNGLLEQLSTEQIRAAAESAIESGGSDLSGLSDVAEQVGIDTGQETKPWSAPVIGRWFDSLLPGIAGLMLVISSFFRGWKISLFAIPAALVTWCGPSLGIPDLGGWFSAELISVIAGGGILLLGIAIARKT